MPSICNKEGVDSPMDSKRRVLIAYTGLAEICLAQLVRIPAVLRHPHIHPTSLLKSCADTFSILISYLENLSFTKATFPSKFSPLLKKPCLPKSDLANFRPISNLNTIGKILERLVISCFFTYFKIYRFFSFTICISQIHSIMRLLYSSSQKIS